MIYNQIWCSNERKDRQTDRGKTVYPPPPSGSGGIKTIIWPWGQRSRSLWYVVKGHYGMRHTALWSFTHIPNIIDRSGKTKKLWSGQASLRRSRRSRSGRSGSGRSGSGNGRSGSGRKNQTKIICLPSFEGET